MSIFKKIFGDYSTKELKRITPLKDKVLKLEDEYSKLSDKELQAKTPEFKARLEKGETLDDILPEAFAACREAAWRVLKQKHYPVQILGGIVLHQGRIAEMKTGEGKTLTTTLPAYLNALSGKGVHIVTVNDYLARRDSEWMGKVYRFMGLTVGLIVHDCSNKERREAYAADITYGTNNEMGFDYLRDNMVQYKEQRVQRGHNFAIVDEVDSILIDEARTPLIISGRGEASTQLYDLADRFAKSLKMVKVREVDSKKETFESVADDGDYVVDEKARSATLTKSGVEKAERYFNVENLMDGTNLTIQHHINQAIKANGVMRRDIDYVVKDGKVLIFDEFTGRIMLGRRYNEGLHQAIEAKEGVKVEHESKTLATITFQNYFRMFDKLSGMTGTAKTESVEFQEIYSLDVIEVPTNKPMARKDNPDVIYKTEPIKFKAILDRIEACHAKGQPVLVGTISIEKSEVLSHLLKKRGIKHQVLNAKFHEKEAEIIAQAGKFGAVTIATNMAGRGTDIKLGGNEEFLAKSEMRRMGYSEEMIAEATGFADTDNEEILEARKTYTELEAKYKAEIAEEAEQVRQAGGLYIIGTERHDSRRIDNQLRGRSGRQGDPGESQFFLSFDDDVTRLFGGERAQMMLERLNAPEDMPLDTKIFSNIVENAQKKVESQNFAIRKNVLQYDDVMNQQRELIYTQRNQVLDGDELKSKMTKMLGDSIGDMVDLYLPAEAEPKDWSVDALRQYFLGWLITEDDFADGIDDRDEARELLMKRGEERYAAREEELGELMPLLERKVLLDNVDAKWMDHLDAMDELKRGIGLRAYGQKDPVVAFRFESYDMFDDMTAQIRHDTIRMLLTVKVKTEEDTKREQKVKEVATNAGGDTSDKKRPVRKSASEKVGPNEPCPCGSGKKYKKCCGSPAARAQQK
ncbi:MAG: preprotein translocase subunit SecA [Acutalibacteraceae bacterium]|nr:preprotein translocase subunit SecA [Acutalibacteraceae bacterium]